MGLGKQAKTLTKAQVDAALGYLSKTRHPARNRAILLLSVKAGLRAKEIASMTWDMVTDSGGEPPVVLLRKKNGAFSEKADERLKPLPIRRSKSDGYSRAHLANSHARQAIGIHQRTQSSDFIHWMRHFASQHLS